MKNIVAGAAARYAPLESRREEMSRCVRCGACSALCPPFLEKREETFSARGRMALIKAVLDRRLSVSDIFKDRLATCTGCLACEVSCPSRVPVTEIIQAAKEQAVRESGLGIINAVLSGVLKSDRALRSFAWLAPVVLHYGRRPFNKPGKTYLPPGPGTTFLHTASKDIVLHAKKRAGTTRGRVAFFPGCAVNYVQQDIAHASVSALLMLGFDVVVPGDQKCCGRPLLSLGDRRSAEELASRNTAVFAKAGADAMVTACASCGLTFKKEYPKLLPSGVRSPVVLDIHELLSEGLEGRELAPFKTSVTYHDPCHLGRGQGLSQTVRNILRSIPGLSLIEMRNADRCCGFGGVMRITHCELSTAIAGGKAKDIISTNASIVATGCPGCRMQITDALRRAGSGVEVLHTVQIVERALVNVDCGVRNSECAKVGG